MHLSARRASREQPVERFRPTTGLLGGWVGLALVVLTLGYVLVDERSVLGLQVALGALFVAALVWTTQMRPRVTAYGEALVLHGPLSDVTIPYVAVQQVTMGQTLVIRAGGRRYLCVGIGRSLAFEARQKFRSHGSGGMLGMNRITQLGPGAEPTRSSTHTVSYPAFVHTRIEDLVAAARSRRSGTPPEVVTARATPELVALVGTAVAFAASLLLR